MTERPLTYVLVTAARNEEAFIEQTIQSVIAQTELPCKWMIVSDGSTDRTDEIVKRYAANHPWIELVRMPERRERHFAAKVQCFAKAYELLQSEKCDVIGNLDADITFQAGYFEFLLSKLAADPKLGVTGTPFVEGTTSYDFRFTPVEHVSGACQLFRWKCYEEIGGYKPVKGGGIDWIAVTTARMKGWKTRTFVEMVCYHHRPMGTASAGKAIANFRLGQQDYYLGGHPHVAAISRLLPDDKKAISERRRIAHMWLFVGVGETCPETSLCRVDPVSPGGTVDETAAKAETAAEAA